MRVGGGISGTLWVLTFAVASVMMGGQAMSAGMSGRNSVSVAIGGGEYAALDGWSSDNQAGALLAFKRSCERLLQLPDMSPLDPKNGNTLYGRVGDWRPACRAAHDVPLEKLAARRYFETWFRPVLLTDSASDRSLFTGYYEPEMKGALHRGGAYQTPVLQFPPEFAARKKAGQSLPTRAEIGAMLKDGRLDADRLALVWLADPLEAFFLHVQGSGRVRLGDGSMLRLAFAAKNERPYTSIGKVLIERGALQRDEVSMQTIKAWLYAHPAEIEPVLSSNESYIFFKVMKSADPSEGPPGAERVGLTPGRSIAVDRSIHPLGSLQWLDTRAFLEGKPVPLKRLMVAQDTGSAIKGVQRADVFWGAGDLAAEVAGRMKEEGRLVALLPRTIAPVPSSDMP